MAWTEDRRRRQAEESPRCRPWERSTGPTTPEGKARKELNVVKDQNAKHGCDKREQARQWAGILAWEYAQVNPETVFCVGGKTDATVKRLQRENLLPLFATNRIWHYSAYDSHEEVRDRMSRGIRSVLDGVRSDA